MANANVDALSRNPPRVRTIRKSENDDESTDESLFSYPILSRRSIVPDPTDYLLPESPEGDDSGRRTIGTPTETVTGDGLVEVPEVIIEAAPEECPVWTDHALPAAGPSGTQSEGDTTIENRQQPTDEDSEESLTEELFSPPARPYQCRDPQYMDPHITPLTRNIRETRDNFAMRKDNLCVFVTQQGGPYDSGAHQLSEITRLPKLKDLCLARAKVTEISNKILIAIPIKERENTPLDIRILNDSLESLLDVVKEMNLPTVSIAKTKKFDTIDWSYVQNRLSNLFAQTDHVVIICKNEVRVPPAEQRQDLITANHSSPIGGHKGVTKTYQRLRQRYYWENMKNEVQTFIQNCTSCQLKKLVRVKGKQPMCLTDTPGSAFDKVALDIMGPLPITTTGNKYILTLQDLLTKYLVTVPLTAATSIDIADGFRKYFISYFGAPRSILTDQGSNFISSLIKALARKFRIKQMRTTAFHPQSNGSVERTHHVLTEYLKHYTDKVKNWDEYLDLAMLSYNTSYHESTKFTPCELVLGKLARLPSSDPNVHEDMDETYRDYYARLLTSLERFRTMARSNLNASKVRSKHYYDRKLKVQDLKVGDPVYLLKEPTTKFGDQYTGPHRVVRVRDRHNVEIQVGKTTKTVHYNKLRKAKLKAPTMTTTVDND